MTSRRRPRVAAARTPGQGLGIGRWVRLSATILVCAALIVGADRLRGWLLSPDTLPIRIVKVKGAGEHISSQQVQQVVASNLSGGFFGIDLNAVAHALTAIPWVYRANVQRRWPGTLLIRLQPQRPFAYWGRKALLNTQGDIFTPPVSTFPKGLPALSGPDGKEHELMQRYQATQALFATEGLHVVALREDARRAYRLWFANGIELVIGRDWNVRRMARLAAAYARVLAPKADDINRIDLRYPNGFAVAWKHSNTDGATAPAKE
ncbi:hypothetical protein BI364_14520 [Acidihalobacter yilgarnensis]|uniref:Cell division protein FtsQ n=2 Tax=Acidihalobacter yilgarnensis TaxID=2819280 RepID=A0A1D8ITX5_9GAMM|nr:hypothetical protein BI364_14520 [Acidihalobacter yilgarnensis]